MRKLVTTPLAWLVIAEFVVVGVLIVLAWNAVASAVRPSGPVPVVQASGASDPSGDASASGLPDLPAVGRPGAGPLPGLNVDSYFWRQRLAQLNQDQVFLEQLEWRVVHGAMEAMQRYVEGVVVPSIERAERAGGGP